MNLVPFESTGSNCFAPFMAETYKQVDIIDLRYFNLGMTQYFKMYNDYDRIIILYNKTNVIKRLF